ncbi:MAG: hypothetical protein IJB95_01525, partial [Clostridia bacterium]|nr:hypothetical protein [Clostridia bacterium]
CVGPKVNKCNSIHSKFLLGNRQKSAYYLLYFIAVIIPYKKGLEKGVLKKSLNFFKIFFEVFVISCSILQQNDSIVLVFWGV